MLCGGRTKVRGDRALGLGRCSGCSRPGAGGSRPGVECDLGSGRVPSGRVGVAVGVRQGHGCERLTSRRSALEYQGGPGRCRQPAGRRRTGRRRRPGSRRPHPGGSGTRPGPAQDVPPALLGLACVSDERDDLADAGDGLADRCVEALGGEAALRRRPGLRMATFPTSFAQPGCPGRCGRPGTRPGGRGCRGRAAGGTWRGSPGGR